MKQSHTIQIKNKKNKRDIILGFDRNLILFKGKKHFF